MAPLVVHEVKLGENGSPEPAKMYVRLPPPVEPYYLRLSMDPGTRASKAAVLHTNFPLDGSPFARDKLHQLPLPQDFSKAIQVDFQIHKSGAYSYFVEYDDDSSKRVRSPLGYFSVDPVLRVPARTPILGGDGKPQPVGKGGVVQGSKMVHLPLDGLVIQSVIAKWMGLIEEWTPHLETISARGYNAIHFTPLQQRGASNSPYSIYDQNEFADDLFKGKLSAKQKDDKMESALKQIKKDYGTLAIADVVWNHTAHNSDWLLDHPEAGFSPATAPHLTSAVELDSALLNFSATMSKRGLPTKLTTGADLDKVMAAIEKDVVKPLDLWQYYVIDVKAAGTAFDEAFAAGKKATIEPPSAPLASLPERELGAAFAKACLPAGWETLSTRFAASVDAPRAVSFVCAYLGTDSPSSSEASGALKRLVDMFNLPRYELYDDDYKSILEQTRGRIDYTRMASHGPQLGEVTPKSPLVEPLFTRLPRNERTAKHEESALTLANNGWVWAADPLNDFAQPNSRAYLRRELIVWGDCVKLRYGDKPEDNPWLWEHMTRYTETLARMFDGFRLDNCHSTPLAVGETLLDRARVVNPDIYVCAELFTGSQDMDMLFVCRLGLNSLIREAYNAHDPKDESSLMYRYGIVKPVGSMDKDCLVEKSQVKVDGKLVDCNVFQHGGSQPHAFMMDLTHDNESPLSKRTAEDSLATGALVTMCNSAIGSNKGFDDLYPKHLNVVSESRHYEIYKNPTASGFAAMKRVLNHIHAEMAQRGFVEGHFSQEGEFITSHRMHPVTHEGFMIVTRTAFPGTPRELGHVPPIKLYGADMQYVYGMTLDLVSKDDPSTSETLKGLEVKVNQIDSVEITKGSDNGFPFAEVKVPKDFLPGGVLVLSTSMPELPADIDAFCTSGAEEAFKDADSVDLNALLYRADGEEQDAVSGNGTYDVPGCGPLVYCGLQGWMSHLRGIMERNDLGHPLCGHLREGTWALDYVHGRLEQQLERMPGLSLPAKWLKERFDLVKKVVPNFLRPKYFALVINSAFKAARDRTLALCAPAIKEGNPFVQALGLTAFQMYGFVRSASLDPGVETPSLAAGLPFFTAGWARTWGRDVFISLRGLCLVTAQWDAAKKHIVAFCSVVKHGLIPNLLDSCRTPRYNSRDSPWWMIQNIQDYVTMAPDGPSLLKEKVKRRFPSNDEWVPWDDPRAYKEENTVAEIVQEILQRHASGIHFREWNAGPNLDMQMSDAGFNIDIEVDWSTGFIHGGNAHNCGTWMDKMGESMKAGNKGMPGTPRDGAPVEITGLLKSALRWVDELAAKGSFPADGVTNKDGKKVTYKTWADLIQKSFEEYYFIPEDPSQDAAHHVDSTFVQRRGIYRDVYGTPDGRQKADYQLRANFPCAMTVAPELFTPERALGALKQYEAYLVGPLGVKTLDAIDSDYHGNYDNSNDSDDPAVAKGRNYHQGPEWVWPLGYFLRAYTTFDKLAGAGKKDANVTYHHIYSLLATHRLHIRDDPWAGLPELTNENGAYCHDSCRTQAWSSSTLLDALTDISVISKSV